MALKNSQYNLIMRQYDLARQSAAAKVQQHRQEVYAQVPGFSRLDEMIAETAGDFARAKISGQNINPDTLHRELEALEAKKAALLTAAGYPADYLEPSYRCPDCKDTGFHR